MKATQEQQYAIKRERGLEFVVVRCPQGHLSQGQKVGDLKFNQILTCTNTTCNAEWSAVLPAVLIYEAVP